MIFLTGDISRATQRAVTREGWTVLSKPVGLPELRQAIARVLTSQPDGQPAIFVVDDDDIVRSAIVEVLEGDGRAVSGFSTGEAFLAAFRPVDAACLLIDAALPGMSGIELLEQLRRVGHTVPAIVITGQSDVPMAHPRDEGRRVRFHREAGRPARPAGQRRPCAGAVGRCGEACGLA